MLLRFLKVNKPYIVQMSHIRIIYAYIQGRREVNLKLKTRQSRQEGWEVLGQACVSWPIRPNWEFGRGGLKEESLSVGGGYSAAAEKTDAILRIKTCDLKKIVIQNTIFNLKIKYNASPLMQRLKRVLHDKNEQERHKQFRWPSNYGSLFHKLLWHFINHPGDNCHFNQLNHQSKCWQCELLHTQYDILKLLHFFTLQLYFYQGSILNVIFWPFLWSETTCLELGQDPE